MEKRIITLCYRKIIDINCTKAWDKLVFEDSYQEFKLQAQFYNQDKKYNTFSELIYNVKGSEKLHFLVSGAIIDYLRQLNDVIPEIANNIGKPFLTFKQFKFEIINSDLRNIDKHVIAINFYSEPLIWHDTIASYLLTSPLTATEGDMLTDMFAIQPFLTIHSIK
ncbi:hypothetical protein EZ428_00855 [Pedobacter frigiditerrae]|uniref:Uncharacterized protein n=1 Tax=Pedobacter frigiditerrae TaxID=2530452 RepID=A0A4R0N4A7_9SPHI|nr:hypothetical protein [Pedobacter frigiditerrae]TCC93352.1 hypothetical protein EZ428_00855 [Pedobacter frigiditerrae]